MIRNLFFITAPLVLVLFLSFQVIDISNSFSQGLKANNAKAIAKHFSTSINLSLNKEEQVVTRFQSELLLADFFRQYKITEVKRVTTSTTNQSNRYFIYNIKSAKRSFRVLVKVVDLKGTASITELRIE